MKNTGMAVSIVLATLLAATPVFSQDGSDHGQVVVTVLPNVAGKAHSTINTENLSLKVAGKEMCIRDRSAHDSSKREKSVANCEMLHDLHIPNLNSEVMSCYGRLEVNPEPNA